jgi:hypothetical protein
MVKLLMGSVKVVLFTTALLSTVAHAGFVHTDWKVEDDGRATLHEETGIEWLKLDNTSSLSINGALSDPEYTGWRLPTLLEVHSMMNSLLSPAALSAPDVQTALTSKAYHPYAAYWMEMMGVTGIFADNVRSLGAYDTGNGEVKLGGVVTNQVDDSFLRIRFNYASTTRDAQSSSYSVFLVSDGGATLSSQSNPALNANNAAYAVDVPSPLVAMLLLGGALLRRKV